MKWCFFLLISLSASLSGHVPGGRYFVVWNVGQGQWVSAIDGGSCEHFDMGGEFFAWRKIQQQCRHKVNRARLSHWDWDHIGALSDPRNRSLDGLCLVERPLGKSSPRKMKMIDSLAVCSASKNIKQAWIWSPAAFKTSNDKSRVQRWGNFLIPGDSTQVQEKVWASLPWVRSTRVLILGHHGSKTSTSDFLLEHLPHAKMAVSSARWRRYRHPHSDVELRLRRAHVALLRTEDWGNLWFEGE